MKGIILALVFLPCFAWAQLSHMEAIPTIRQATQTNAKVVAYSSNVASGSTLIVGFHIEGTCATPTIADTLTTTWGSPVASITTASLCFYVWIGAATSSGADTVTITSALTVNPQTQVQEWTNLSTTVDASATATNAFVSQAANMPAITTTKYRDLIIDFIECQNTDAIGPAVGSSYEPISGSGTGDAVFSQFLIPSVNPTTFNSALTDVNNRTCGELALAIESTTSLTVSTTAIPNAVQGQSYSFQLGATGGTGTNTWTTTAGSLPSGLSLSSTGVISGTPTASNPNTIAFKVTDGSSATATKNLTIAVGTSLSTPVRVNHSTGTTSATISSVTSGNLLLVLYVVSNGWNTVIPTDSFGTIFVPLPASSFALVLGGAAGTCRCLVKYYWGFAAGSGSDTISAGLAASMEVDEFSNIQDIFDTTVPSIVYSSSGGSTITSNPVTTPVAVTLVGAAAIGTVSGGTVVIQSPYTDNGTLLSRLDSGYQVGASVGSNTASWAVTANTSNLWAATLLGFRPTKTGTAAAGLTRRHNPGVF